ncbi:hypothetical protein J31TS4_19030 [Paenibacillus sp. J31TS4]|uniref:N-acetylmuramoyl-L-alanine amidase n=1 Tax=Paenibacillus sp. J31TS4 TaxID=2807195 RepID=UPI001B2E40D4|nr:N-acetylmuramoyl-L-alanine amidase [Paenibacillus sp. J31TS4]GIP38623.1 hypothetical protein J31TS4_19030 [Paenibacillus sp. J31TS4]
MQVIWKGNQHTNSSSRGGMVPCAIVDHISAGSMGSMDNWFTDPSNTVSSAHFGVSKTGAIHQYVPIDRMAWANGLTAAQIPNAPAQIVRDMGVNPNLYSVSIEHEGTDGALTEAQFTASVQLHAYIRDFILDKWGRRFPLDKYHVIGHCHINPVGKPNCPGPKFPWDRLYQALSEVDNEMELLAEIEKLRNNQKVILDTLDVHIQHIYDLQTELRAIKNKESMPAIPEWAAAAVDAAKCKGLIDTPAGGSYDFYRLLTILNRKGLI